MTLALPPDWPACGAWNTDRRRWRTRCRAKGDGWGQRCRHHGGLVIPDGPHALVVSPSGVFIWRTFRGALHPLGSARQRVSWRVAALLIESGAVYRGFFFGRKGSSLLRRLSTGGVEVAPLGTRAPKGLAQYAFRRRVAA